ncbi:MAG: pdxA [Deltaproteobacteria bacterium]|nr:pdxA [Deltaproteobacteria bacterium]
MGDPAGIGGEIILKALPVLSKKSIPVIVGDRSVVNSHLKQTQSLINKPVFRGFMEGRKGEAEFIDLGLVKAPQLGIVDPVYGEASYRYIIEALKLVFLGEVSAIVTCPISKASMHKAGISFPGHTELFAHFGGVTKYIMMMANRKMRVSLVTIHISLKEVPKEMSVERVLTCISITHRSLKVYYDIDKPFIKVCGLNPHAGEQGIIGSEEDEIRNAINRAKSLGIHVEGPFPADTLFHAVDCDAYIAMYHDQGLIPVKTMDFRRTVNITLGLPFIRTSPGHGTGFDIAGKGIADPSGLIEAYRAAEEMSIKTS